LEKTLLSKSNAMLSKNMLRVINSKHRLNAPLAVQHALGFVKICAENGVELAVTLPISGNPNRIKWTSSGADIASIQADFRKMQQVAAFQEHFVKGLEMYENAIDDWWISPQ
jgi:hypothetical protein